MDENPWDCWARTLPNFPWPREFYCCVPSTALSNVGQGLFPYAWRLEYNLFFVDSSNRSNDPGGTMWRFYFLMLKKICFLYKRKIDIFLDKIQNFKQYNFRVADVSNLKINKRLNVEQPKLRINKIEN